MSFHGYVLESASMRTAADGWSGRPWIKRVVIAGLWGSFAGALLNTPSHCKLRLDRHNKYSSFFIRHTLLALYILDVVVVRRPSSSINDHPCLVHSNDVATVTSRRGDVFVADDLRTNEIASLKDRSLIYRARASCCLNVRKEWQRDTRWRCPRRGEPDLRGVRNTLRISQ